MESSVGGAVVFIKIRKTEFYYLHPRHWVPTRAAATQFASTLEASTLCFSLGLKRVELLLYTGDPEQDIRLPVR